MAWVTARRCRVRPGDRVAGALGRGERLHRQRVDLLAHSVAEGAVDALVAGDPVRALELGRDDGGEEMAAVAFDLDVLAGEVGGDEALDVVGVGSAIGRCYRVRARRLRRRALERSRAAGSAASGCERQRRRAPRRCRRMRGQRAFTAAIERMRATDRAQVGRLAHGGGALRACPAPPRPTARTAPSRSRSPRCSRRSRRPWLRRARLPSSGRRRSRGRPPRRRRARRRGRRRCP